MFITGQAACVGDVWKLRELQVWERQLVGKQQVQKSEGGHAMHFEVAQIE
jgi:hypothetical protein